MTSSDDQPTTEFDPAELRAAAREAAEVNDHSVPPPPARPRSGRTAIRIMIISIICFAIIMGFVTWWNYQLASSTKTSQVTGHASRVKDQAKQQAEIDANKKLLMEIQDGLGLTQDEVRELACSQVQFFRNAVPNPDPIFKAFLDQQAKKYDCAHFKPGKSKPVKRPTKPPPSSGGGGSIYVPGPTTTVPVPVPGPTKTVTRPPPPHHTPSPTPSCTIKVPILGCVVP